MLNYPRSLITIIAIIALLANPAPVCNAQSNDEANTAAMEFDSRERELRRKEQELLRAMDLNSVETTANPSLQVASPQIDSQQSISPSEANNGKAQALEIQAPEPKAQLAPNTEQSAPADRIQPAQQQPVALKELTHHPALEPPQKAKVEAPPVVTTNRIRTKTVEEAPDGTTADRLGSFYRIDRAEVGAGRVKSITRPQTVPIQRYAASEVARPALLTSDDLATIQHASTALKTGPHRLDSTLLKIPQYSEVHIDYRSGEWYRVKTNSGIRGWVPGSALLFDADTPQTSTVRVGAVRE